MRKESQRERRQQIEQAAYELIDEKGFLGMSMLGIAKRAKASNETLYRWYGDKVGLFRAMVLRNAELVTSRLEAEFQDKRPFYDILTHISPILLSLLVSDRAVALNRAAASDASGELGQALSQMGRDYVLPKLRQLFVLAQDEELFQGFELDDLCQLYINLLVGDVQIRRVTGAIGPLSDNDIAKHCDVALERLMVFA